MAVAVLVSTMSFTINKHYCGDVLVDSALFIKAKSCGMDMNEPMAESGCEVMKKDCCTNEQLVIQGQDELKISFDKLTLDQQIVVATLVYSYISQFEDFVENPSSFIDYPPPLIIRQIYKLDESYLI